VTPRVFAVICEAAARRLEAQHNELVWHAYNSAAFQRHRRLTPDMMRPLLIKRRDRRPQTWEEQREIARMITLAHGGKVH
jgi:hypothetical protein